MLEPSDHLLELCDEARAAFESGGEWEFIPESAEGGDWYPYQCGEAECTVGWHQSWLCPGYRIADRHLFYTIWDCDGDGNWELLDECDVTDPHFPEFEKEYAYENSLKASREYSKWVAKHGRDPLGEFIVQRSEPKDFYVEIEFRDGAFWFKRANFLRKVSKLPQELRTYLGLDDQGKLCELDWQSMDEFEEKAQYDELRERDGNRITIKLKIDLPRSESAIVEDLKKAARRSLKG